MDTLEADNMSNNILDAAAKLDFVYESLGTRPGAIREFTAEGLQGVVILIREVGNDLRAIAARLER